MTSPLAWWRSFDAQSRALMAAAALNFTAVLFLPPPLFVWLLVADLCATCAALGWWCLVLEDRVDEATTEALQQAYEARIATDLLERYRADARVVIPLRRVPTQREPWPPVARAVEAEATPIHDETAVDLFMRSVERWGEDAER